MKQRVVCKSSVATDRLWAGMTERSHGRQRRQKLGYKFRQCELQKIPYKIIVGEKEMTDGVISVNKRKEGDYPRGESSALACVGITEPKREGLRRSPQGPNDSCRLPQDDRRRPQSRAVNASESSHEFAFC